MSELRIEILPEVAKRELASFYEYLVFKYLKGMGAAKEENNERNKKVAAFSEFKKLRDRINPKVDKSIDIDSLINEVNNDIILIQTYWSIPRLIRSWGNRRFQTD